MDQMEIIIFHSKAVIFINKKKKKVLAKYKNIIQKIKKSNRCNRIGSRPGNPTYSQG